VSLKKLEKSSLSADVVVVGGGLAGVCCSITAAREGIKVVLVQDRPVLGGNASSEVRLWVLGATSHMGNNNRWAREGGVIDELLVENMYRNPEGNAVIFDSVVLDAVKKEENITLLLNTAVHELDMKDDHTIRRVRAFSSQNQVLYELEAPLFVDASGDGIVGFLAGAEFRMGAEAKSEFGEGMAPDRAQHTLLGHSLYFYSRDTGRPVKYVPPSFALQDITKIPRYRDIRVSDSGCRLWWLEYGGELDTIAQTEEIKWQLWSVAYGVWNFIKNSGTFPDAENLTLEWMGTIPGKRESRRFVGDGMLTQNDIVEQRRFEDAVSFGGWAIDLHPPDGVFSEKPGCTQFHSKGVYPIPYRSMYSRNIRNLFVTGRLLSATHIAFGSTRVMATCASNGQAVGMAAALCTELNAVPHDLLHPASMHRLQQRLLRSGQHIPGVVMDDRKDVARAARITASSTFELRELRDSDELADECARALLLPLERGYVPRLSLMANVEASTVFEAELWGASREGNTTPDVFIERVQVSLAPGQRVEVLLRFETQIADRAHYFVIVRPQPGVKLFLSRESAPGVMTLSQKMNAAVAKSLVQTPPVDSGIDTFAFWLPERRPKARNLAVRFAEPLCVFGAENVLNGFNRPWAGVNGWVPAAEDRLPSLTLEWTEPRTISEVAIVFDTDFDHPMESVLMSHPERIMPGCVTAFRVATETGRVLAEIDDNHQTLWRLKLTDPVEVRRLRIEILQYGEVLPAIYNVSCY
jgi:hypothetical protein